MSISAWSLASEARTEDRQAATFHTDIAQKVVAAEKADQSVVRGEDGWLFFSGELRHISVGKFWGPEAAGVSKASRKKFADPMPAILEFDKQLKSAGVELLLVPVPPKAFLRPEALLTNAGSAQGDKPRRLDAHHQAFYKLLEKKGVQVLDLWPHFAAHRGNKEGAMYCKQDSHWTSRACALTAKLIADRCRSKPWFSELKRAAYEKKSDPFEIKGDLWTFLEDAALPKERLPMLRVGTPQKNGVLVPPSPDRQSPVVLMGDSHTLVFSAGDDMFTRGAGLPDHLAAELGTPIDLVGVRGSGVTVPRIDLARRKDNLKGKKMVVWCFSARQFTESTNGWMTRIPVIRKK